MLSSPYKDKRIDFFKEYFALARSYSDYLANSPAEHQERWRSFEQKLKLSQQDQNKLLEFKRKMPVLVLSGSWCGDCARQGPMFHLLSQHCTFLDFKFIDNRQHPELQDELRINGAEKVPVVVSFSEDFFELSRFGDRHLSVYRRKLASETGASCDPGLISPEEELQVELREWIEHFERLQAILRLSPHLRKRYSD